MLMEQFGFSLYSLLILTPKVYVCYENLAVLFSTLKFSYSHAAEKINLFLR